MNASLIGAESVELLSKITGQKLSQRDITPPVIFLAALVTLLLGVMLADGTVAEEEKQKLLSTLYRFSNSDTDVRRLTHRMIKGVHENKVYAKTNSWQTLTAPLSESERLLLLAFGYEMSASDGQIDIREQGYLQLIANHLDIDIRYQTVLEAVCSGNKIIDPVALAQVKSLLDPARFHELDTVFVKAASDILATLPANTEQKATQHQLASAYKQLENFKKSRQQLENYAYEILQIVQACVNRDFLPDSLIKEVQNLSNKLKNKCFRIAVVGEFSQGKSTLLNALVREEIQPTRAIPCSGTITVLRHGAKKRVICCYKDGRKEEIPLDQYKAKAAIPKEEAQEHRSEQIARSELNEIIFEHPDLDLCRNGVEIIDSPGLNENPERTTITKRLLSNTDAAIFLTNAMRLLPEKEKELIHDVRTQLNGGKENEPAENLFMVVNFMDLLDEEEDRQDVIQRLESFVKKENLLVPSKNRIHYISAKAAIKAIVKGSEDEYQKAFQTFTQALEEFLTIERGAIEIRQSVKETKRLIQASLDGLHQAEDVLEGKIKLSESEKSKIWEKIGEISGRDVKIRFIAEQQRQQVLEQAKESGNECLQGLSDRMKEKSKSWSSEHSPVWSRNQLIQDYINQFMRGLSKEIDEWGNNQLQNIILKQNMAILDAEMYSEIDVIKGNIKSIDQQIKTNLSEQLDLKISGIKDDFTGAVSLFGGMGIGGTLATVLILFSPLGLVSSLLASVGAAVAGALGLGIIDFDGINNQIKLKIVEMGLQNFYDSIDKVVEKLEEIINSVFAAKVESVSQIVAEAISLYENLLEQQEKADQETIEQRQAEKALIVQKRQELKQVQQNLEAIATQ
jgi:uncharacterized tellurite resistance protein B-like protein/GTPase Era involved in 16S rRNA processing